MRNFRIFIGIVMIVLAVSLCISEVASAQGNSGNNVNGNGSGGLLELQAQYR